MFKLTRKTKYFSQVRRIMPMNKQAVIDIVRRILNYYGYSIYSSDICDLLAEKDSERLFIKYEPATNFNSIKHFSNDVQKYGGRGVLISDSFDEKTRPFALDHGLTLRDRNELESWIGRAVLSGALEAPKEKTSAARPRKESAPPPTQVPVQVPEATGSPKFEYEKTIRLKLRSVPINIGKSDAISIAEARVGSAKSQTLKFIPVWYYSYSFSTQKKFKSKAVDLSGSGEGYVNAIKGENSFNKYKEIQDNILIPTQNYEIKQPVIVKNDALKKASDAIIREHSKEIRINEMIGDTIVFENKMFAPDPEDINIEMELIYIPLWEIKGKREAIEINGYDGHTMAKKVYDDADFV